MIFATDISSSVNRDECEELARLAEGKIVLEMGSYYGRSTIALASTAKVVYSVDWHLGDAHVGRAASYESFVKNLGRYDVLDKVKVFVGVFEVVVPTLGQDFDLVFVDGQHDEKSIIRDGALAISVLRPSGILAFHDYGSIFHPIQTYVDDLVLRKNAKMSLVRRLAIVEGVVL